MKNNKKTWAIVAAILAVVGITGGAMAKIRSDRGGHFVGHISNDLALSASQRTQLETMWNEVREQRQQMRAAAAEKVRAAVTQDSLSREDVLALMEMRRQNREETRILMAEKISEFHGQLDPAQRERLATIVPKMLTRGGDGFGRGHRHGGRHGHRFGQDDNHGERHGHRFSYNDHHGDRHGHRSRRGHRHGDHDGHRGWGWWHDDGDDRH